MASVPVKLQPTVQEVASIITAVQRCPRHPQFIILPWFGLGACCLYETLQQIGAMSDGAAAAIARDAIRPTEGIAAAGMPRLWRDR